MVISAVTVGHRVVVVVVVAVVVVVVVVRWTTR